MKRSANSRSAGKHSRKTSRKLSPLELAENIVRRLRRGEIVQFSNRYELAT
jgi:hypothetical protein